MKFSLLLVTLFFFQLSFCQTKEDNKELAAFFKNATEDFYKLNPLLATNSGDYRYNDQLPVTFTDSYNEKSKQVYTKYLDGIKKFDRSKLNENDKISYDI